MIQNNLTLLWFDNKRDIRNTYWRQWVFSNMPLSVSILQGKNLKIIKAESTEEALNYIESSVIDLVCLGKKHSDKILKDKILKINNNIIFIEEYKSILCL